MLTKKEQRLRRARQTRIRIATQGVARLTVNRTNLHIYASVISGDGAKVLASASTAEAEVARRTGWLGQGWQRCRSPGHRQAHRGRKGQGCRCREGGI
jgi:large subunit ribosomal protein L18